MIDYKRSFEKLVDQIKFEHGLSKGKLIEERKDLDKTRFNKGMDFAYSSILGLAEMLEKGEFDFGDNNEEDEDNEDS